MNEKISGIWGRISGRLLPFLERVLPPMQEHHRKVAMILEFVRPEDIVRQRWAATGRPPVDLSLMARAFVAKMELNLDTTKRLIETLKSDEVLRRIVGFPGKVPSNATFSRAFHEFSRTNLAGQIHEALKSRVLEPGAIVIDSSLDATAIEGREKAAKKPALSSSPSAPRKRGRPRKGEPRPEKEKTRLQVFCEQKPSTIDRALPKRCDWGCKRNSQGKTEYWKGFKLHLLVAHGEIPLSAVLTSASVHDSQAAPYLLKMGVRKVTPLYTAMDAAYDAQPIRALCHDLGIVSLIDSNPRGQEKIPMDPAKAERYKSRSSVERVNSLLKECFGGRHVRVRGPEKVFAHLMFGIVALTATQLLRLGMP